MRHRLSEGDALRKPFSEQRDWQDVSQKDDLSTNAATTSILPCKLTPM